MKKLQKIIVVFVLLLILIPTTALLTACGKSSTTPEEPVSSIIGDWKMDAWVDVSISKEGNLEESVINVGEYLDSLLLENDSMSLSITESEITVTFNFPEFVEFSEVLSYTKIKENEYVTEGKYLPVSEDELANTFFKFIFLNESEQIKLIPYEVGNIDPAPTYMLFSK